MNPKLLWSIPLLLHSIVVAEEAKKPNIVFIFADDLTIYGLGSTSNGEVKTPNLDRLRNQGTFYSHAFNQGGYNGAISAASRAMVNTGRYLWRAMDAVNGSSGRAKNEWPDGVKPYIATRPQTPDTLWSQYMKAEGYTTYLTGKWHVNYPASKAFDHAVHVRGGMPNQKPIRYKRTFIEGQADIWNPADSSLGGYWAGGIHWSEIVRDDALKFIDDAKAKDNPFFMYLAFNAPHDPRQAPQEYLDMYPTAKIQLPANYLPQYPHCEACGSGKALRDEKLAPYPRTPHAVQVNRKEYFALISHLDTQVGKIIDALKENKLLDNTYIIFTADHGLAVGDHGFIGKQNQYDASVRVPLFIVGPTIKKGKTIDNLVYLQDVMPTTLELAGSQAYNRLDFQSLLPSAQGKRQPHRDAIINCYIGCQRMIRTDRYKMIVYPRINLVRLYDIKKDPHEMNDLAQEKKYKRVIEKLFYRFQELQDEINDPLDITPYYNQFITNYHS